MRRLAAFFAAALVAAPAVTVTAQVPTQQIVNVDFAEYASPTSTTYQATFGAPLTSKGFDFYQAFPTGGSRNVLATWGQSDNTATNRPSNLGAATSIFADAPGVEVDMYVAGDDPFTPTRAFNLYSLDVAHLFSTSTVPVLQDFTLQFFAVYLDGSEASQTFTISAPPTVGGMQTPVLQTLRFSSAFQGVANVFWNQNGSYLSQQHQFTNVVAQVAPEPSTYVLMAGGLAGVLVISARRRRDA